jgi:hypothetical protein
MNMDTATAPTFGQTGPFTEGSSMPFDDRPTDAQRFGNQPPLEERVMLEFEEDLDRLGVKARVQELLESAARCPDKIEDDETAGKAADLIKLARAIEQKIEDAREVHNRPLINARAALKGKADGIYAPLADAIADIRRSLNAYAAEQERKRREEQRRREEEERRAREALEKENIAPEVINEVVSAPPPPPKPIARGSYGSSVSGATVWKHERLVPIAKLPKAILENAHVVEAVDKVIAAMVRNGARNPQIKGVNIFETTQARVR